jgi:TolA-binding protein
MKKHLAIATMILMSIIYGCNNSVKEQNSETLQTKQLEATDEIAHQHEESDSIEFNNGAKWKVVPEMMAHIRNMESDINGFSETKHTELKDFTQLGSSLQKNIDLLTSNCTMEGKAHDELHKWLLPYIDMVDKLNKSKNNDEALHTFEEIKASYKTLNLYFE